MQFETHLYLKLQNDENRIIQNFFSIKNHFKMMISKLFNIKKKIPCVGEIAHALFGFQHLVTQASCFLSFEGFCLCENPTLALGLQPGDPGTLQEAT